jgi:hypothetical protein
MSAGNAQAARFIAILGVTGCGKSTELKRRLGAKKRPRTLIWSPKERIDNYAEFFGGAVVCSTTSDVLKIAGAAGKRGGFHIVFVPTLDRAKDEAAFSVVCKIALAAGNLTLIVEELHSVTKPSHAPHGWALVNFMGRGSGVEVFGLSQRPASVDKAFMASLSELWVAELPHPPDQETAAKILGVPVSEVAALCGYKSIHKDMRTKKITKK